MANVLRKSDRNTSLSKNIAAPSQESPPKKAPRLIWGLLALFLLIFVVAAILGYRCRSTLWGSLCYYYYYFSEKEHIKALVQAAGPLAPLLFIVIQVLQVVFAPVPGEATGFLGGFLFGVPLGFLYSTLGLTVGSVLAFLIGRWLEEHYVARWVPPEILKKFDFLMERQGALISFILFILPGFPKDYLCFILGLSHMPLRLFLLISTVGRLPGTLLLTLQGAKVYEGKYLTTAVILGLCLVLVLLLGYYREAVYAWIRRFDHKEAKASAEK